MKIDDGLKKYNEIGEHTGFNPYYNAVESSLGDTITIEGKEYINLAANNYLGLADDPRVKKAVIDAVEKYGVSMCGTPIAIGYSDLSVRLEKRLAAFVGVEEAVILPSCYQANNGLFQTIAEKNDVIIFDHYAHSSLVQGIQSAGCTIKPFLHNNTEHLKKILSKSGEFGRRFVVTESVFSTEGSIAPAKKMEELCMEFDATLIIDDSHGIGVIGENGRGILEEENLTGENIIYTASLGKAFANLGGMVGGDKKTIAYLRYYFPHLIYSTALPPMVMAGIEKVLDIVESEFKDISKVMQTYKRQIAEALLEAGYKIAESRTMINSIESGDAVNTINITKKFYENGILATPFIEPSVPHNQGRVRLIAGANLKPETIAKAVKIIKETR